MTANIAIVPDTVAGCMEVLTGLETECPVTICAVRSGSRVDKMPEALPSDFSCPTNNELTCKGTGKVVYLGEKENDAYHTS